MDISLKAARVNAGMRQKEVAKAVGIDVSTLSRYERGLTYPDIMTVKILSEIYNVPLNELIFLPTTNALSDRSEARREEVRMDVQEQKV